MKDVGKKLCKMEVRRGRNGDVTKKESARLYNQPQALERTMPS